MIITGHRKGLIRFWLKHIEKNSKTDQGKWLLFLVHQIIQQSNNGNVGSSDAVDLAISTSKETLFTRNRHGLVYSFVLHNTNDTFNFVSEDRYKECMTCRKSFSTLGMHK